MSAQAHLSGVYPPTGFQVWDKDNEVAENWQPIPVHTIPQAEDYVLKTDIKCPPYDNLIAEVWESAPAIQKIQKDNQEMLDYLAKNAGLPVPGNLKQITEDMCDAVNVEVLKNLTLPKFLNEEALQKLKDWDDIWIIAELATDEMVKWAGGALVNSIQETFTKT